MKQQTILIVDDTAENISVLYEVLMNCGYKALIAENGKAALELLDAVKPDLILLDVLMPSMNGFETCKRLKADRESRDIPVIFMSALSDTVDKVKGFELGAVDYITKPLNQDEVLARVRTHLTIRSLQKGLEEKNRDLQAFAHTVAHDLKNPIGDVVSFAGVMQDTYADILDAQGKQCLKILSDSSRKAIKIIEALLLLSSVSNQEVKLQALDMASVIEQVKDRLQPSLRKTKGVLIVADEWPAACGYPVWVEEIWMNYLTNGLKYGGTPPRLELGGAAAGDGTAKFWVLDNGPGLSEKDKKRLFKLFSRLESGKQQISGHGLGLSIVQRIATKLGGTAGVETVPGKGCKFYFTLPCV
ncbi:MAG: response regulator [Gammaproteobacteria bacterium]|nr:response regulator [Gammaproteobacteria bacterium]